MAKLNEKAAMFQRYVAKKDPTAFGIAEVPNAPLHSVVFRSQLNVENTPLPLVVEIDDSPFGIIRVVLEVQLTQEDKKTRIAQCMNRLNAHYKIYKFYLDPQYNLLMDTSVIFRDSNVDGNQLYSLFEIIAHDLKDIRKEIKQAIWGEEK